MSDLSSTYIILIACLNICQNGLCNYKYNFEHISMFTYKLKYLMRSPYWKKFKYKFRFRNELRYEYKCNRNKEIIFQEKI